MCGGVWLATKRWNGRLDGCSRVFSWLRNLEKTTPGNDENNGFKE